MVDTPKVDFVRENGVIKVHESGQPLVDFGGGRVEPYDLVRNLSKVGELAQERDTFRTQAEEHARSLERYKGVDLGKYQKDQEILGKLNDGQIIEAKLVEEQIRQAVAGKDTEIGTLKTTLAEMKQSSFAKDVMNGFASPRVQALLSPAIRSPKVAYRVLGDHCYEDSQGNIRVKDERGQIVRSRRNPGEPAEFEEAIEILLDTHSLGETFRAPATQSGAGSEKGDGGGRSNGSEFTMTRSQAKADYAGYKALSERAEKAGKTVQMIDG